MAVVVLPEIIFPPLIGQSPSVWLVDWQGLEPLASAAVDRFMGRETSHVSVNLCLLPVIGGVLLVGREASLTWGGLFFAVASSAAMGKEGEARGV